MIDEEYMDDERTQQIVYSPMQPFYAWLGVVCAAIITAAICWNASAVVELKSQVAVLVARPEGISRAEYLRDQQREEAQMAEMYRRIAERK